MLEISLFSAFAAGVLAFFSPCILPIVPVYISMMSSKTIYKNKSVKFSERIFLFINSLFFILGFSVVFILLGSTATFLGKILNSYSSIITRVGGAILIIFGLQYIGVFKIRFLNFEKKFNIPDSLKTGYLSSFLIGIIFSFGWVPCVGMILSGILLLASKLDTLAEGMLLLAIFSLGLAIPFILSSIFLGLFSNFLKRVNRHLNIISIISGAFIILLGLIFVTDSMGYIINFLSRLLPFLNKINF